MHRRWFPQKEVLAWILYDWANSAYVCSVMTALLPVYFTDFAAKDLEIHMRTAYWGYASAVALILIALITPLLGVVADYWQAKKKLLAIFLACGVLSCIGLFFVKSGDWFMVAVLYVLGHIGFSAGNVFYEALLCQLCPRQDFDRVSLLGYALGYAGGGLLLTAHLGVIYFYKSLGLPSAEIAIKLAFASVGLWWLLFSLPLFFWVKESQLEPEPDNKAYSCWEIFTIAVTQIKTTLAGFRYHKEAFKFLLAFWFYMDVIGTIYKMASIYGREVGINREHLIGAIIMVQFIAVPSTLLYIRLSARLGTKKAIQCALAVYGVICLLGFFMEHPWQFWLLAFLVALVQGGAQALSRSAYARLIPAKQASEFFSFFSFSSKVAGVVGPVFLGFLGSLMGTNRYGLLGLLVLLFLGSLFLQRVQLEPGAS